MKKLVLTAVALFSITASPFAADFVNPSFEDPINFDGPLIPGTWRGFNGGGALAANSLLNPRTGLQSLGLTITGTPSTFAGAFQDVVVASGTEYIFSGWHLSPSDPLSLGVEVRIEWRNSTSEVGRTPNLTPIPTGSYSPFSLTAMAPAGADIARCVYAIQSFSTAPLGNGAVYVDDVSFAVVPEPSTMVLAGLGAASLLGMRRRQV
jgi:hypothetical protein